MTDRIKLDRRYTPQPVKINQERIDAILKDIEEGSTRFHAAEANGIAYTTFYYWVKQGQFDLRNGISTIYGDLVKALRKIEQDEIKYCRKNIVNTNDGHKGAQWTLERVYWKQFSSHAPITELAEDFELEKGDRKDEEVQSSGKDEKGNEGNGNEKRQEA
jgi:hypothetical protein